MTGRSLLAVQVVYFAAGTFYTFPWKPLLCYFFGSSYSEAYRHFRRDHHSGLNLGAHVVALGVQLGGNFGLLRALETRLLPGSSALSRASAACWLVALASQREAARGARMLAATAIVAALASAALLSPAAIEGAAMAAVLALFALGPALMEGRGGAVRAWDSVPKLVAIFGTFLLLFEVVSRNLALVAADYAVHIAIALGIALLWASSLQEPTFASAGIGAFGGRLASILTGRPEFVRRCLPIGVQSSLHFSFQNSFFCVSDLKAASCKAFPIIYRVNRPRCPSLKGSKMRKN